MRLIREAEAPFSQPWTGTFDAKVVCDAALEAFRKLKISPSNVSLALPEREMMVRYFEIPFLPRRELKQAIRFEAQKYLPFDPRELYHDYELFPDKANSKIGVALTATKKNQLDALLRCFSAARIRAKMVETASLSVLRALEPSKAASRGVRALVFLNNDRSVTVVMCRDRSVLMSRSGLLAAEMADEQSLMDAFAAETGLAISYFSKNFKQEKIQKLIFVREDRGDTRPWLDVLKREFGLPVESANLEKISGRPIQGAAGTVTAFGAALKSLSHEGGRRLNFVPTLKSVSSSPSIPDFTLSPEQEKDLVRKVIAIELGVLALVILGITFVLSSRISDQKKAILGEIKTHARTTSVRSTLPYAEINGKLTQARERLTYLGTLTTSRGLFTAKLNALSKLVPDDVRLLRLEYTSREDKTGAPVADLHLDASVRRQEDGGEMAIANRFAEALSQNADFMKGSSQTKLASMKKSNLASTGIALDFSLETNA